MLRSIRGPRTAPIAAGARILGAVSLAGLLSSAAPVRSLAADVHPTSATAPDCSPLPRLLAAARRMGEARDLETALYVGVPGAALLQAFNRESSAEAAGAGLFVAQMPGVDEVMVGVIAPDHTMVCDGRIMSREAWASLQTAAFGRMAALRATALGAAAS